MEASVVLNTDNYSLDRKWDWRLHVWVPRLRAAVFTCENASASLAALCLLPILKWKVKWPVFRGNTRNDCDNLNCPGLTVRSNRIQWICDHLGLKGSGMHWAQEHVCVYLSCLHQSILRNCSTTWHTHHKIMIYEGASWSPCLHEQTLVVTVPTRALCSALPQDRSLDIPEFTVARFLFTVCNLQYVLVFIYLLLTVAVASVLACNNKWLIFITL